MGICNCLKQGPRFILTSHWPKRWTIAGSLRQSRELFEGSSKILVIKVHMKQYSGNFLKARKSVSFVFLPVLEINTIPRILFKPMISLCPSQQLREVSGP